MRCPKCNSEIEEGYLYCKNCGEEIRIVPDYDPRVEDMLSGSLKDVFKAEKKDTTETEKKITTSQTRQEKTHPSGKKVALLLFLAAAVILIAGMSVFILLRRNSYEYQYEQAVEAASENHYSQALEYLDKAMEISPDQTYMWLFKAQIERDSGNVDAAESSCRYILSKLEPENQEVYTMLIQMYIDSDDLDQVKDTLSRCPVEAVKTYFKDYIAQVPVSSFADGIYYDTMEIELDAGGLDIYFTTDGSKPTINSTKYEGPIHLETGTTTIRAVAVSPKGVLSDEAIFNYEISFLEADPPVVSPVSGEYPSGLEIVVQVPDGCTVLYTLDGSVPDMDSEVYTGPVRIYGSTVFTAVSVSMSGRFSDTVVRRYTISAEE